MSDSVGLNGNQLMLDITTHAQLMYRKAEQGNWAWAKHSLRAMVKSLVAFALRKPNLAKWVEDFDQDIRPHLEKAIDQQDWHAFQLAWAEMITLTNMAHQAANKPFIILGSPAHGGSMLDE